MSRKHHLIYINTKNTHYMLTSFKFNYIPYKIEKVIVWINEIYLCVHINIIIYVIITDFLIIQYIFIIYKYVKEHIIHKNSIYNVRSAQGASLNLVRV